MKINEVKEILASNPTKEDLETLKNDERIGVKKLIESYYKKIEKEKKEKERFSIMQSYERNFYEQGKTFVAGVDEAGRGPLAGPLVVAAVILPQDIFIDGLNDSKQLSEKKREKIYVEILEKAIAVSVNIVSISNIDKYNIYQATKNGMLEVLQDLKIKPEAALLDAMPLKISGIETISLIHGDALSISIAAASIIAKVTRDKLMYDLHEEYPEYGFKNNKGYGSKEHMEAIKTNGATKWHRRKIGRASCRERVLRLV